MAFRARPTWHIHYGTEGTVGTGWRRQGLVCPRSKSQGKVTNLRKSWVARVFSSAGRGPSDLAGVAPRKLGLLFSLHLSKRNAQTNCTGAGEFGSWLKALYSPLDQLEPFESPPRSLVFEISFPSLNCDRQSAVSEVRKPLPLTPVTKPLKYGLCHATP